MDERREMETDSEDRLNQTIQGGFDIEWGAQQQQQEQHLIQQQQQRIQEQQQQQQRIQEQQQQLQQLQPPHNPSTSQQQNVSNFVDGSLLAKQMAQMNARLEELQIELNKSKQEVQEERNARQSLEQRLEGRQRASVTPVSMPEQPSNPVPNIVHGRNNISSSFPGSSMPSNSAASALWNATTNSGISATNSCMNATNSGITATSTLIHKPYDLPEFSGFAEQWPVFIAAFRQSTQAFGYTALQNLFRLQKCLKGEARECVEFLLISPDNVNELISTLEFRFGRPEILARSQMVKIRELPDISERRIDQLITFSTRVTNMVAFLNTDASRHVLSEATLLCELVSKLPVTKQLDWAQHSMTIGYRATVLEFADWLKKIAQSVSILTTSTNLQSTSSSTSGKSVEYGKRPTKHVLLNMQHHSSSSKCEVCRGTHFVESCPRFRKSSVSERWKLARRLQLCFNCLREGHTIWNCESNRSNDGKSEYHDLLQEPETGSTRKNKERNKKHRVASKENAAPNNNQVKRSNPFDRASSDSPVLTCRNDSEIKQPLFRILPVTLHGPERQAETFALLDEGSALTLLDENMSEYLQLEGPKADLNVQWIGQQTTSKPSRIVQLRISGASRRQFSLKGVRTIKELNLPSQSLLPSQLNERFRNLPIGWYRNAIPKILIGLDHCRLGMSRRTMTGEYGGPIAAQTSLGWVTYGPQTSSSANVLHIAEADRWDQLDQVIREYLTTDSFGVKRPEQILESDDDIRARYLLQSTTVRRGVRYQTGLLWRSNDIVLPDSRAMARKRLTSIEKKMSRDPEYKRLYTQQIEAYLNKGYARQLTKEEAIIHGDRTWYLPHFGVQTISKPGKLRLVFDAAAAVDGISLNSVLLKGPDLNQPLINILFRFRLRRVGVCADISEMFSQIEIQPSDRCSQRFLWRSSYEAKEPDTYEMCVMTFGATCSPTSAQYVKNLNASRYEEEYPEAVKAIRELHYVDDYVASFDTEEHAVRTTKEVVNIHKRGGFVLRGFVSNSKQVLDQLGGTKDSASGLDLELDCNATEKILGLRWCTRTDTFVFGMRFDRIDVDVMNGIRQPTKRELLSAAMSVFDPFGFIADFMLHTKIMIQTLWRLGVAWDECVPDEIFRYWKSWCKEISRIKEFNVPRCYFDNILTADEVQLHIFADASEEAFAAVGYWRIECRGKYQIAFIMGKVKCAPLKILSVPRLELQAAVLASRLHTTIIETHPEVKVARSVLWTDSRTVQQWIQSTNRRFKPFVAHRVSEILDSTRALWWRWLPTKENVADDATRSKEVPRFEPDGRWIRGPVFLSDAESMWPTMSNPATDIGEPVPEEISTRFMGIILKYQPIIDINRFSKFLRLWRSCAWVLRFINNSRVVQRGEKKKNGEVDIDELNQSIDLLCRQAQRCGYPNEYSDLDAGRPIDRSSPILVLMPYMDDNKLIRLYGRTDAADAKYLPVDAQRPILLPRDHRLTELLVRHHHEKMGHQFEDGTICSIRSRYWVPKLRPLVRYVKKTCPECKIRTAEPNSQIAGQLPVDRLTPHVPVFHFTGLDYFGPVNVTVGRRQEKRWIALFTCLTTRAIHMEVAQDLSTDACLMCIKNFCNLRGAPARIRSDCGTNFVGADHEIRRTDDFIDQTEIQRELGTRGIEWLMNCPANPEAGGAWERLVQSTKRVLAVTLKEVAPRVETLRSLVIEAANILNSRPLTNVPVSPNDLEPITPNHFLLGRTNSTTTTGVIDSKQLCSRKQWRVHQQLMRTFWHRWVQDYLPELTRRTKYHKGVGTIEAGALVLVCDANQSRGQWVRGRVERVIVGTDGRVRMAEVRTNRGIIRRPVSKLAVLDVEVESH